MACSTVTRRLVALHRFRNAGRLRGYFGDEWRKSARTEVSGSTDTTQLQMPAVNDSRLHFTV